MKTKIYKLLFLVRTMIDNECNILSNMSKTEFREFRSLMVEMVLHTGDLPHIPYDAIFIAICCHILVDMVLNTGDGLIAIHPANANFSFQTSHLFKSLFRHVNAFLPTEVNEEFSRGF